MKLLIESKVAIGYALSLLIIILFSLHTFIGMRSLICENENHQRAQQMLKSVDALQYNLIRAESSCREYTLKGDSKSCDSYNNYMKQTSLAFDTISVLLEEKEYEILKTEFTENFVKLKLLIDKSIEAKSENNGKAALSLLFNLKETVDLSEIAFDVEQIEAMNRNKELNAFQNNTGTINQTISSFLLLVFVILIVLTTVYYLFKRDLADRKKVKAELHEMNTNLEERVKIRTEAFKKSEKKYRLLADNVRDVISLHESDGTYTYVSESSKIILGYDPQELIGRTGFDFMHPDDVNDIKLIHSNLVSSKRDPDVISFRFLNKEGVYIWVESLAKVIIDPNGKFGGIIICTRDVSERIKAEQALKEHQRMLQSILDNTSNPIFIKNINGEYLLVNKEYEKILNQINADTSSGVQGKNMKDILPPELLLKVNEREDEIAASSKIAEFEFQYSFEGETKTYSFTKFPMYDDNKKMVAICGIATNITSHKKAQQEILDSKARLRALIQNSIDPVWAIDENFRLVDFNNSCRSTISFYFGMNIYLEMDSLQMYDDASKGEWEDNYRKSLAGEYFSKEMKFIHDLEDYYFDVSFNPIIVHDKVTGVAVFARDITSHKKTEKQLKYKVNELNTFMYKATHDLRAPLVSLMGLADLAGRETDTTELKQYFKMIGRSVVKMDKLLVDLVNITNVSQGELLVNQVDFDKITSDIIDSLRHYPNFESIEIWKKIGEHMHFYNDDKLLYSVMQNLIDNAIKYSKRSNSTNPVVTITVESNALFASIKIEDNGIGIPDKSKDRVFDMFYRATTESSGTGLGLYIVKSAVEKMNGKIALCSEENNGTSISIILPNLLEENEHSKTEINSVLFKGLQVPAQ